MIDQRGNIGQIDLVQHIPFDISIGFAAQFNLGDIDSVNQSSNIIQVTLAVIGAINVAGIAICIGSTTTITDITNQVTIRIFL